MSMTKIATFGSSCGYSGTVYAGREDYEGNYIPLGFTVALDRADHYNNGSYSHDETFPTWERTVEEANRWIRSGSKECYICERNTHKNFLKRIFRIENSASGADLGEWHAETREDALRQFAEAGGVEVEDLILEELIVTEL